MSVDDHVVIGAGPTVLMMARLTWPSARAVLGRGPSGDHALLASVPGADWIDARFDRLVIGSRDGIFAAMLAPLRQMGVAVGVVAPAGSVCWKLRRYAHFVPTFKCERHGLGAA